MVRTCVVAGCVASLCIAGTGCKESDVLTELLLNQDSQNIDEDNESHFLENIVSTLDLTEELPQLEQNQDVDLEREQVEDQVTQGEDQSEDSTPNTEYESSVPDAAPAEQAEASGDGDGDSDNDDSNNTSNKKSKKDKDKSNGDKGQPDEGKGDGTIYKGDGGTGTVYGDEGDYEKLPSGVQTVVAFGEYANMVVSFAGEHALAGADKTFLSNSFIKSAYKKKDIANAKTVVVDKEGNVDVDYILELQPDALLLDGTSYKVSASDKERLKEANIDVVYMPAMNSAAHIKRAAANIGKMFGSATLSGDDAQAAADKYISWHDELVKETQEGNGGISSSIDFETGEERSSTASHYTLYVSQWDNAIYTAKPDNVKAWTDKNGVAISQTGYGWSPMSYYLSVGGTQNVSATFKAHGSTSQSYYIWQFNLGRVNANAKKNWSGRSASVSLLSNSGTKEVMTKYEVSSTEEVTLGSSKYKYVVARTQRIAAKMKKSRDAGTKTQTGLYSVYKQVSTGGGKTTSGFLSKTGDLCQSFITGSYDVLVNPSGLYSSWIGGSTESVLEAVWIDDVNDGSSNLTGAIKDYYKLFYNVKLSSKQVKTITKGLAN